MKTETKKTAEQRDRVQPLVRGQRVSPKEGGLIGQECSIMFYSRHLKQWVVEFDTGIIWGFKRNALNVL